MKKIVGLIALVMALCLMVTACGSKKSEVAQKADELIARIGDVTLDSSNNIQVARTYYDLLTDEEKAQVETLQTLTDAEAKYAELCTAAEEQEQQDEYAAIYALGVEYDSKNYFELAYDTLKQLPEDYEDVKPRLAKLEMVMNLSGCWVCNQTDSTVTATNGKEYKPVLTYFNLTFNHHNEETGLYSFILGGLTTTYKKDHIFFNNIPDSYWKDLEEWGYIRLYYTLDENEPQGCTLEVEGGTQMWSTGYGHISIAYSLSDDGMLVQTITIEPDNGTAFSAVYTFSKAEDDFDSSAFTKEHYTD